MIFIKNIKKMFLGMCTVTLALVLNARTLHAGEIKVVPRFSALPVITGFTQKLEISLPPDVPEGGQFDAIVEASSGGGVMLFPSGPSDSGSVACSREAPVTLEYRWAGAPLVNASVTEKISVEIRSLGISGEAEFQVGVDLRITEISLPQTVSAGVFNPMAIVLRDEFNHGLDVASLFGEIGVLPEVSISLVSDDSSTAPAVRGDPVVSAFFADKGLAPDVSYPPGELRVGSIVADAGKFVWRGEDGRVSGITPPSGGAFHIEAMLKSNAGGVPLKHWSSPSFEVFAGSPLQADLPELVASTLGILSRLEPDIAANTEKIAYESPARHDAAGVAPSLGAALRVAFADAPLPMLGRYAAALGESGMGGDELSEFLKALMAGFEGYGVLLVTKGGLAEWRREGGGCYEGGRYVAVPFAGGENFTVRLAGSGDGDVSLWKIIADGVNAKKYDSGKWVKDITVYTAETSPPQNAKTD